MSLFSYAYHSAKQHDHKFSDPMNIPRSFYTQKSETDKKEVQLLKLHLLESLKWEVSFFSNELRTVNRHDKMVYCFYAPYNNMLIQLSEDS